MAWRSVLIWSFVLMQISVFATTIYLHRGLAHRAVRFHPAMQMTFRTLIWMLTGIVPRQWAAVHRKHHRFTDVDGDPHSPMLFGYWKVQFLNVVMYRREAQNEATIAEYASDLAPDRLDRRVFDHSLLGPATSILLLWPAFGLARAAIVFGIAAISYVMASAGINALGHTVGKRPFANTATNLWWLAALTGGEGLHNNHHERPGAARFAARAGEPDLAWPVIRALQRLRLVQAVKAVRPGERQTPRAA